KLSSLRRIDRGSVELETDRGAVHAINPLEQARQYAHAVADVLKKDPQLVRMDGRHAGALLLPWSYGVVLPNIARAEFDGAHMGEAMEPTRVVCRDEMLEDAGPEAFQSRLWQMFPWAMRAPLTLPQIDRVRWHLFPDVRIPPRNGDLFDAPGAAAQSPGDILAVMDLQQEQLARSLGSGHRVIHGVAGSGKTLILGHRARYLAQACVKPILVLCYNRRLADRLTATLAAEIAAGKVVVKSFHAWCRAQLMAYHVGLPQGEGEAFYEAMVARLIRAVDLKRIPGGQYEALMIDEGHDFKPEWFRLIVQMVDPASNSLLVLYDDAQAIYQRAGGRKFSFKSVGVDARGRTTVLKINYRNTREVLDTAARFAAELLAEHGADEDHVPTLTPLPVGRDGPAPLFVKLPSLAEEAQWIALHLKNAHASGLAWRDMAVLYREYEPVGKAVSGALRKASVPVAWQKDIRFSAAQDAVRVMTLHGCKGLEFPLVVMAGLGHVTCEADQAEDEARLLYVGMTRATERLALTCDRETRVTARLGEAAAATRAMHRARMA
ncbi:MAG: AAA family ATPase, partial [Betaproteobacteria bacterium]|nr:AAA family ATPase [Betaproteobacteria bacterium]